MKLCHEYPVSFEEYRAKHEKTYGTDSVEGRYQKACWIYSAFKYESENKENREIAKSFRDLISDPIDTFDIWWDC